MPGANNNPLEFADDKISEVEKKLAEQNKNLSQKQKEIFARINGLPVEQDNEEKLKENQNNSIVIKNLRTFQGDVAEAIQKQNASVVTIAVAEKKKQEKEAKVNAVTNTPPPSQILPIKKEREPLDPQLKKNILLISLSILLIILGAGSIFVFYKIQKQQPQQLVENSTQTSIIGWSKKNQITVIGRDRDALIEQVFNEGQKSSLNNGEILYLELVSSTTERIDTQTFLNAMKTQIPPSLARAFGPTFMFGIYQLGDRPTPFLLIRLDSFDRSYDGMLTWEKTLFEDIGSLFTSSILPVQETTSTNGSSTTKILQFNASYSSGFFDETIKNKDVRILENNRGETLLVYSFLDKETLLITSQTDLLKELVDKLVSKQLIR